MRERSEHTHLVAPLSITKEDFSCCAIPLTGELAIRYLQLISLGGMGLGLLVYWFRALQRTART